MAGKYKIITDPKYGYLRAEPIPSKEEVNKYYLEEFYSDRYKKFNDSSLQVQNEERDFFYSKWESIRKACAEHFGKTRGLSLFDIGFGFAQAMIYFHKKGMRVSGLEPSTEGAEYARARGFKVFQAGIEDLSCVGDKQYEVVTMLNVLEHLRHPAQILRQIKTKLLKPGGLLVIDVPNEFNDFQTAANKEHKLKEWWICPPNHINYFSASSLRKLLTACGYQVIDSQASFPLELFLLMGDVYVGNNKLGKACHQKRVAFEKLMKKHGKEKKLSAFYRALAQLDLGRQVTMYATAGRA